MLSSTGATIFLIFPFYLYFSNGKVTLDSSFVLISMINILFIFLTYRFSKIIKFKQLQIKHYKKRKSK